MSEIRLAAMKERILQKTQELMFRYGIKTVTMDDIARELGISKKTIYQHFEDKDAIVKGMAMAHFEVERQIGLQQRKDSQDPIQEMVSASEMMRQQLAQMNPTAVFDMKKYHPNAWALFTEFKESFLLNLIKTNLQEGVKLGLYRKNIDIDVLARLRLEEVEIGLDPQIFDPKKFNFINTQTTFLDHFIRGIVTEKGLELYNSYLKKIDSIRK